MNNKRRVVVTGMGVLSSYGVGADKFWDCVKNGESAISTLDNIEDLTKHIVTIGGEIKKDTYNPEDYFEAKEAKRLDKFIQYGCIAAKEAVEDSGITTENVDKYRFGVIVSSAAGGFNTIQQNFLTMLARGFSKCSPYTVPMLISNMCAGKISMMFGAKGVNKAIVTACASSAHAIGDAYRSIQYGDADVMIAGGSEATLCDIGIGAFAASRTLSKRNDEPQKASRPFDKDRDGFVMSEGAGALILEELEHAKKRGAKIYAEVVGYGQTADAFDVVAPNPDGLSAGKSMELAVEEAGITPKEVDYINAHGTATHLGDIAESKSIERIFGDVNSNSRLRVSSTKSMTGHMLGAAGAIESIICIKTINDGIVPPTINLDNIDEETGNLNYVPNVAQKADVKYALTNSFGFGGHNATVMFKKFED